VGIYFFFFPIELLALTGHERGSAIAGSTCRARRTVVGPSIGGMTTSDTDQIDLPLRLADYLDARASPFLGDQARL
jgi:hypothetical protein